MEYDAIIYLVQPKCQVVAKALSNESDGVISGWHDDPSAVTALPMFFFLFGRGG